MSQHVLTQEQLDLRDQIQQLTRLNDSKEEKIRELELYKERVSNSQTAELLRTIEKLENEIRELEKANKQLKASTRATKINELQQVLLEEQRLRKYSETFAEQMQLKCAEECQIKELTTELCQLLKAEIEIDKNHIQELQEKLKSFTNETEESYNQNEEKGNISSWSRENFLKNRQLKFISEQLKGQLSDLHKDVEKHPAKTIEDQQRVQEIENWIEQAQLLNKDLNDIEIFKKDLKYMKSEIENRRKTLLKYNSK